MLIENNIEDGVSFFHVYALSSAVALKVNCDIQLTLWPAACIDIGGGLKKAVDFGLEAARAA